jgi:hypothetical protein
VERAAEAAAKELSIADASPPARTNIGTSKYILVPIFVRAFVS